MPLMLDITYLARHCSRITYASNAERHLPMHRRRQVLLDRHGRRHSGEVGVVVDKKYCTDGAVRLRAFLLEVILVLNYGAVGGDAKRPGQ